MIYKKSKQRQLSEVNLGNTFTNCGLFNKKFASHKKNSTKSSVVHSPFHNSLLSSLNLQTNDNMNSSHKENIFNRDIIIKKRNDKVICKKRFNMLSETEETLLTNAIQKRKKVFPKIFNVSTKYSSRGKIKQNAPFPSKNESEGISCEWLNKDRYHVHHLKRSCITPQAGIQS